MGRCGKRVSQASAKALTDTGLHACNERRTDELNKNLIRGRERCFGLISSVIRNPERV